MARAKNLDGVNFSGSDAHLRDALFMRNLHIPLDENNKLIRRHAVVLLQEYEDKHKAAKPQRKGRVIFHRSTNPSAGPYVFASLNERTFIIPYEKPVLVDENVLRECIDRAKTVYRIPEIDKEGNWTSNPSYSPVYPYTLLEWVDPEEPKDEASEEVSPE